MSFDNYQDFGTRAEWLNARKNGIGGSDAAIILGLSPYKTIQQLYLEKIGGVEPENISGKPQVQYGINAEEHIRELFKLDYPDYDVLHLDNRIYYSDKYPCLSASLDGLIYTSTSIIGILEIKTAEINSSLQHEQWKNKIPNQYYCQCLHYLNVTGVDFVHVRALLKLKYYSTAKIEIIDTVIERKDVEEDIKLLEAEELRFWECVINKKLPAWRKLPEL